MAPQEPLSLEIEADLVLHLQNAASGSPAAALTPLATPERKIDLSASPVFSVR
jgi:hypothetical protein